MTSSAVSGQPIYSDQIEFLIEKIVGHLTLGEYGISLRSVALLLLQGDSEMFENVELQEGQEKCDLIRQVISEATRGNGSSLHVGIVETWHQKSHELVSNSVRISPHKPSGIGILLGHICSRPLTGFPILVLVLYFGLYQFVGVFGGGYLVGLVEESLFGEIVNPFVTSLVSHLFSEGNIFYDLFVGEYGIWTLGVTYAVGLILPITATFFFAFSILEDSGYLPRLGLLVDRMFKKIGLNGRGVIPIVLGFGCDTMATLVTRILESRRERIIATFLLSLAIPCTAQLAVITAILSTQNVIHIGFGLTISVLLLIWGLIMALVFLVAGYLASKVTPGRTAPFYLELPPMRWPSLRNILMKTFARIRWYFIEVFPLFIIASVVIWMGLMSAGWPLLLAWLGFAITKSLGIVLRLVWTFLSGLTGWLIILISNGLTPFEASIASLQPLVRLLSLPSESASVFLFGFFRRDYAAAGLDKMMSEFALSSAQILIIAVTITLFLPCIAQFLIIRKERGVGMAVGMLFFTLLTATIVGAILGWVFRSTGWLS